MPDLTKHFESAYLNAHLFQDLCQAEGVDPYHAGLTLTIAGDEQHDFYNREKRKKLPEPVIYFREIDKALVLKRPHFAVIAELIGTNTDDWKGHRIILFLAKGEGAKGADAIRVANKRLAHADAPLGPTAATRFAKTAAEHKVTTGDFEAWAAKNAKPVHQATRGKPVADWPVWTAEAIGAFFRAAEQAKGPPVKPAPKPLDPPKPSDQPPEDHGALEPEDIPF